MALDTPSSRARGLRRPGRTPGSANLGIALAILVVLLPLLLNAATAAPPTAAEFSPNAQHVIQKAPQNQAAAVNGTAPSSPPNAKQPKKAAASPSPQHTPPLLQVPANQVKNCVGPPPLRQIEDPQSPPCIAYWAGDNGGKTATGVTRDSIYIAVPTPENAQSNYTALFNFFNKRFQFYGRRMIPEFCSSSGGGSGSSDQASQQADAALAAAGCGGPPPFASQFYRTNNGAYYMPTMGCKYHTIVLGSYSPYDSRFLNRCAPYQFQYPMDVDTEFANIGEWVCNRIAGRPTQWAAGNDGEVPGKPLVGQRRKFGILLAPFTADDPVATPAALAPITSRLHACGSDVASKDIIINPATALFDPSSAQNAMLQLKNDNVTSVICMCNFFSFGTLQRAADSSAYQPEWVTGTFGLNDVDSSFTLGQGPVDQMQHTFGLTFQPEMLRPLENPYNVAIAEGDPTVAPETDSAVEAKLEIYRGLLVIASGIQMAGPHLTVASFGEGLRKTVFPNPLTSTHAGFVGFGGNPYSMTTDAAEWWYSTTAVGPFSDSTPGTICYVDAAHRRRLGEWPHSPAPFFGPTCDTGA